MIELKLPPKVQIDKHIPSGYVILGYTEKEMQKYALEFSLEYNKELIQRIIELESELESKEDAYDVRGHRIHEG